MASPLPIPCSWKCCLPTKLNCLPTNVTTVGYSQLQSSIQASHFSSMVMKDHFSRYSFLNIWWKILNAKPLTIILIEKFLESLKGESILWGVICIKLQLRQLEPQVVVNFVWDLCMVFIRVTLTDYTVHSSETQTHTHKKKIQPTCYKSPAALKPYFVCDAKLLLLNINIYCLYIQSSRS